MTESNKMKEMPVNKLMVQMGIPMILSMALQAVYNIVDSAFVGNMKVGSEAALKCTYAGVPGSNAYGGSWNRNGCGNKCTSGKDTRDREIQKRLQRLQATVYSSEESFMQYVCCLEFLE